MISWEISLLQFACDKYIFQKIYIMYNDMKIKFHHKVFMLVIIFFRFTVWNGQTHPPILFYSSLAYKYSILFVYVLILWTSRKIEMRQFCDKTFVMILSTIKFKCCMKLRSFVIGIIYQVLFKLRNHLFLIFFRCFY